MELRLKTIVPGVETGPEMRYKTARAYFSTKGPMLRFEKALTIMRGFVFFPDRQGQNINMVPIELNRPWLSNDRQTIKEKRATYENRSVQ
jgi:hypothetical protein